MKDSRGIRGGVDGGSSFAARLCHGSGILEIVNLIKILKLEANPAGAFEIMSD